MREGTLEWNSAGGPLICKVSCSYILRAGPCSRELDRVCVLAQRGLSALLPLCKVLAGESLRGADLCFGWLVIIGKITPQRVNIHHLSLHVHHHHFTCTEYSIFGDRTVDLP